MYGGTKTWHYMQLNPIIIVTLGVAYILYVVTFYVLI